MLGIIRRGRRALLPARGSLLSGATLGHMRRRLAIATGVAIAAILYTVPYFVVSRVSASQISTSLGEPGYFAYCPLDPATGYDLYDERIHFTLRTIYFPLWKLDHAFGGPEPLRSFPLLDVK